MIPNTWQSATGSMAARQFWKMCKMHLKILRRPPHNPKLSKEISYV